MDTTQFLRAADGTRLWTGTVGDGPHLVLCDGLACDGFIWPYIIDHFVGDFTILRWHYRGHGQSDTPDRSRPVSMELFCEDLELVLDAYDIDSAILAGHSMGVQVILAFMNHAPQRVDALIPICGSYKRPLDTFHGSDLMRRALPLMKQGLQAAPDLIQNMWQTLLPREFWYQFAAYAAEVNGRLLRQKDFVPYLEHAAEMDLHFFLSLLSALANHSTEYWLSHIQVPTLIIAGERDTFTPLFRSTEMHHLIDGSQLVVVPEGTHVAPLELPDLVTGAMSRFFDEFQLR